MMQALNEKEWGEVNLEAEFDFERGKEKNMAALSRGDIPLISARKVNNGIKDFVEKPTKVIIGGNVISLNNDGDGGAGLAYFQPMDFALDTHVTALHPKKVIPEISLLFLSTAISKQHAVFGHGRSISLSRARRLKTMLPVTRSSEPDYEYMAQYASEQRANLLMRYKQYATRQLSQLKYITVPALSKKEWKKFKAFGDEGIFEIVTTRSSVDSIRLIHGANRTVPYVTRTDTNNGIASFVSIENLTYGYDKAECITVGLDTQTVFWQPSDFVTGQNIQVITGQKLNRYVAQFVIPLFMSQMKAKFNWGGNGATLGRMKRLELMLPTDDSGQPDYSYMEQYVKNTMLRKYEQYLAFLNSRKTL